MSSETCTRVVLSSGLRFPMLLEKHLESEFDLYSGLGCSRPFDKYPEGRGRAVSSPDTLSQSYGRFSLNCFIWIPFLYGSGTHFRTRLHFPKAMTEQAGLVDETWDVLSRDACLSQCVFCMSERAFVRRLEINHAAP